MNERKRCKYVNDVIAKLEDAMCTADEAVCLLQDMASYDKKRKKR